MQLDFQEGGENLDGGAPRALVDAIETHIKSLWRVELYKARGSAGYVTTTWHINVLDESEAPEGEHTTPELVADRVYAWACKHATKTGPGFYRVDLLADPEKRSRKGALAEIKIPIDMEHFTEADGRRGVKKSSQTGRDPTVDALEVMTEAFGKSVSLHLETLEGTTEFVKESAKLANPMALVKLEIEKLKVEKEDNERDREFAAYQHDRTMASVDMFSAPVAAELPGLLRSLLEHVTGGSVAPPGDGNYLAQFRNLTATLTDKHWAGLQEILDLDAWALLEKMRTCEDEMAFAALCTKFGELLSALPHDAKMQKAQAMGTLLGPSRLKTLLVLIQKAAL